MILLLAGVDFKVSGNWKVIVEGTVRASRDREGEGRGRVF